MRQWELIGITDHVPAVPVPQAAPSPRGSVVEPAGGPPFFWSCDSALRMVGMSGVAADAIGPALPACKGRDLLEIFGLDGPNAGILDAHISALGGDAATFMFHSDRANVRCRVQPLTDGTGRASGTYCMATRIENVDVRDDTDRSAVA